MSKISKRDSFERELIQLVQSLNPKLYGQRGTHSDGVDVLLFQGVPNHHVCLAVRCEVKTSIEPVRYFRPREMEQYDEYMRLLLDYGLNTIYCFRTLTKKKTIVKKSRKGITEGQVTFTEGKPGEKWRFFNVNELPLNNRGTPYLDLFSVNAMKIIDCVRLFERYQVRLKLAGKNNAENNHD